MPSPLRAAARNHTGSGTAPDSDTASRVQPVATSEPPVRTRRAEPHASDSRAWVHEPTVQVSDAVASTAPANRVEVSRTEVSASDTNASAEKNAKVSTPRVSTAAGRPRAARRVPSGVSRRNGPNATAAPTTAIGTPTQTTSEPRPPSTAATPTTSSATEAGAARRLCGPPSTSPAASGPGTVRSAGSANDATSRVTGISPRNTQRQPTPAATSAATRGDTSDGTTHAVDIAANALGRSTAGNPRLMQTYDTTGTAPAPRPCSTRPTTSTGIDGARPPTASPVTKIVTPASIGPSGATRSTALPPTTTPTSVPR